MTDILCGWLNNELAISQKVDQSSIAKEFSSGYLIGEVLCKYQLQDDFDEFSKSKTADSKLNNFTRLEPVLHLLGIPFDVTVAREVMTEKHGTATRLLYQLYIALTNKKKANLTGVAMETQRPAAPAKLNAIESGIYKERLKHITPRQTDLNLEQVASRFHEHQIRMEQTAFQERLLEQDARLGQQQRQRQILLDTRRKQHDQQKEMVAKLKAAKVHIPKAPLKSAHSLEEMRKQRVQREAGETLKAISDFENKMNIIRPAEDSSEELDIAAILKQDEDRADALKYIKVSSNDEYIGKIRKRLNDDASAREQREKRRRKVLGEQMASHEAREEARREEMMVSRMMRQSQQERRIAVQLLQTRHEKEVIRNNRMLREQQYQERRLHDHDDALNREAEMAKLNREEYERQIQQEQEHHAKIAAQRAEERYRCHYDICYDIMGQIVDFACKVAEYNELTEKNLPNKLLRDWRELFTGGCPLYEEKPEGSSSDSYLDSSEDDMRNKLLDALDFKEYKVMDGEWKPPEITEVNGPPRTNPVVGHIIHRLYNIVHPPTPPPPIPQFPPFPIRACVVGKLFSGKSTVVKKLAEERKLQMLEVDRLVHEAVVAHKINEMKDVTEEMQRPETSASEAAELSPETMGDQTGSVPNGELPAGEATVTGGDGGATAAPLAEGVAELDSTAAAAAPRGAEAPAERDPAAATDPAVPVKSALSVKSGDLSPSKAGSEVDTARQPQDMAPGMQDVQEIDGVFYAPTLRNRLGERAQQFLRRGQPVDDEVVVEIIADAIKQLPEGTGWVLDGYPQNITQAKLLEKALSGYDAFAKENTQQLLKTQARKSDLVPDPRPAPPPPEPTSGIDVVILFDIEDELCVKRASGRTYTLQGQEHYHEEFKPAPKGSATGIDNQEKVIPVTDPSNDQEQIQQRITSFHDSWEKMEEWFTRFGTLRKVDATNTLEGVFEEVEQIMEDTLNKVQEKDLELPLPLEPELPKVEEPPETAPGASQETVVELSTTDSASGGPEPSTSRTGRLKGSGKINGSRSSSKEGKKDSKRESKGDSPKRDSSAKKSEGKKSSRGSSPKSPKNKKKGKTPTPEPEPEPEVPAGPPPPKPGEDDWEFVDLDLEPALAEVLAKQWDGTEKSYTNNTKHVFRQIRQEQENIYRYFYQIRKDYLNYLRRPDHKQEFVSQWQKDYNSVPDDMREDEETRAELHQRVDDLRERLWNICDERKQQGERERDTIVNDGWLDDRLGLLSNHYITIMQAELDRFQDTVRMLKDYYKGMDGQIPDQLNANYERVPLIELPVERPETPSERSDSESVMTAVSEEVPGTAKSDRSKSPRTKSPKDRSKSPKDRSKSPKERVKSPKEGRKSRSPSARGKRTRSKDKEKDWGGEATTSSDGVGLRVKIPLVPRRPVSPDPDAKPGTTPGKDKKDKKAVKKGSDDVGGESPIPPQDPDERLLFDAHCFATGAIGQIISVEMAAKEAEEEEAERMQEQQKEKSKGVKPKGGKKGKSRSPSPKKGKLKDSAAPTPTLSEDLSEEDKLKKQTRERMRQEYYFSVKEEETAARVRLEVIKAISILVLQELKIKADSAYKDMMDWLGSRFLKEMESIETMSEVMRHAVEEGWRLKHQLIIQQDEFFVDMDHHVLKSPPPVPVPPPTEPVMAEQFTVDQLFSFYQQFSAIAPQGVMSSKSFMETLENMASVTHGMEIMPDAWMTITSGQIQELSNLLASDTDYVDWRRLLQALTYPIPTPTQAELLHTLNKFRTMDQTGCGHVTREQFDRMNMWFDVGPSPPDTYNRMVHLKRILFDIFADHSTTIPKLDYVSMLLYFSVAPNSHEGFLRALSVTSNCHMPHLQKFQPALTRAPSTSDSIIPESTEEGEDKSLLEPPMSQEDIPPEAVDNTVPLDALFRVLQHSEISPGDSHRFTVAVDPEDITSKDRLALVYAELGDGSLNPLPYRVLIEHPLIQDVVLACKTFRALDLKGILSAEQGDLNSMKTMD